MSAPADITGLTVAQLADRISARELSPVEAAEAYLARIEALDERIGAFATLTGEQALTEAKAAEAEIMGGAYRGPLHGVPYGTKDIFWTKGVVTANGSKVDAGWVPDRDARVVELLREAGSFSLGKLHTVEYAFDPTGRNDSLGTPHNPWRRGHFTGGSSSGSGAAVAAGMAPWALGSDTGGSIRVPSALCGLTGLKPTYGVVSRAGVTPLSWTFDTVGPMCRDAADAALVMNALAGYDPADPRSIPRPAENYVRDLHLGARGLRVRVPWDYIDAAVDAEVRAAFAQALDALADAGMEVAPIAIPELEWGNLGSLIITAEAAALHEARLRDHAPLYEMGVRLRLESGKFLSSSDYLKAQQIRVKLGRKLTEVFEHCDLLALPTTTMPAPRHGETTARVGGTELTTREAMIRITRVFNQNGLPALSAPCGFSSLGLPIGLMLVGRAFADATVLRAAAAYQRVTDWHTRRPPL